MDTMTINNYFLDPKKESVDYSYWSNLLSRQHISIPLNEISNFSKIYAVLSSYRTFA